MQKKELRAFRKNLREFERFISDAHDRSCAHSVVSVPQCHLLLSLEETGPSSVKELAEELGLDRSTVSRTVDSLVGLGLVDREEDPNDRRLSRLRLTKKGTETAAEIHNQNDELYSRFFSSIPKSRQSEVLEAFRLLAQASRNR